MEETPNTLREAVLAKLGPAKAALDVMLRQGVSEITGIEWQKGYVKALEEILDVDRVTLRRHTRHHTAISAQVVHPQYGAATIADISLGGCGLITALPLTMGDMVELSCTFPNQTTPVTLAGRLVRVERHGNQSWAGVEFSQLSQATLFALPAFLTQAL